ncbi:uncharacterized protein LOC123294038 [Chrysoperla carnea]|uniref:uncharacterized protein LOC123294038 n=1 Tax=Chrysoperla carnea TaxID=189513 RepID=UPI001D089C6C|nr:uncharacterized protein LOC123294038 [Chrysoperla carnea]
MNDSPKTPILRSNQISTPSNNNGHFTPCRQMGLSRKRKSSLSVASPLLVTDKSNTELNETPKHDITKRSRASYPINNETPKSEVQRKRVSYPLDNARKRNLNVLLSNEDQTADEETLKSEINACKARIEDKRKILQELQKSTKSTDNNLENLIVKWRTGCQNALNALLDEAKENRILDMNKLLNDLNIPASLVHFDTENEVFL